MNLTRTSARRLPFILVTALVILVAIGGLVFASTERSAAHYANLSAGLNSQDLAQVQYAASTLAADGSSQAIDTLIAGLGDNGMTARSYQSMTALQTIGQPAVDALTRTVAQDKDAGRRAQAAELLGYMQAKQSVKVLTQALNDQDASVRAMASWALNEFN